MAPKLKVLVFGIGLMYDSIDGAKRITLRKYRPEAHDFTTGEVIIGRFKEGYDILLEITADTEVKTFDQLSDEEAQEDLFKDAEDAFRGLKEYYPDLKKTDRLAIVRFKIAEINSVPVIQYNDHEQ